jgi:nickel/cobalt exporter
VELGAATVALGAHPLGNFTINHLTKLRIAGDRASVHYVLDMAEIPTYAGDARRHARREDVDAAQLAAWATRGECAVLVPELHLTDRR